MYPYNHKRGQTIQSDAAGVVCDKGFLAHFHIDAADNEVAAANSIIAAVTLGTGVTVTKTAVQLAGEPKCAMVLTITGNQATAVGDVVITGKDMAGEVLIETIVSTGAALVTGTKAFAFIDSIVFPARGAAGDTIAVGMSDKFGIPYKLAHNTVLAIFNNHTATTVAASHFSETVLAENYLDPTAALGGSDIDVYLIV